MSRPKPLTLTGTAELSAMIERIAPAVLRLLADGVPRRKPAIVAALAGRHPGDEVELTLIRLAVTERVEERDGKFVLNTPKAAGMLHAPALTCSTGWSRAAARGARWR